MTDGPRKVLAVLEIIGGVVGLLAVAVSATQVRPSAGTGILVAVLGSLFLLSLVAGVLLWMDKRAGRVASVVVLLAQLPKVVTPKLAFMVSFGFDVAPFVLPNPDRAGYGLLLDMKVGSHHMLMVNPPGKQTAFGFSVASCVGLWVLLSPRRPAGVPSEVGSPDAVTAFRQSREAIRQAKNDAEPEGTSPTT